MGRGWIAGLAGFAVICAGSATGLEFWAAMLYNQADEFNRSLTGTTVVPPDVSDYYARIFNTSFLLQDAIGSLAAGAVLGTLALLAVLAMRWERREVPA